MGNLELELRGEMRNTAIRYRMSADKFPNGFTIQDILDTIGLGDLFDSKRQIVDHMRGMVDKFEDIVVDKKTGPSTYMFKPNLYNMLHRSMAKSYNKRREICLGNNG